MAFFPVKGKKSKLNNFETQKQVQKPVTVWFKPDPLKIIDKVLEEIFEQAWNYHIKPRANLNENHDQPIEENISAKKQVIHPPKNNNSPVVKGIYSSALKTKVKAYMKEHSL